MRVSMNSIMPNVRELPISLKLNSNQKYASPLKSDGYIINPRKFASEIKDVDFKEIKALLLMMIKGNQNFINELIKTGNSKFVNTIA